MLALSNIPERSESTITSRLALQTGLPEAKALPTAPDHGLITTFCETTAKRVRASFVLVLTTEVT